MAFNRLTQQSQEVMWQHGCNRLTQNTQEMGQDKEKP
jgi:hypothetical protein